MQAVKKQYSHFLSLPFIRNQQRELLGNLQKEIGNFLLQRYPERNINQNRSTLAHVTLCMLELSGRQEQRKGEQFMHGVKPKLQEALDHTVLTFPQLKYFSRYNNQTKRREVSVIYLDIHEDDQFSKVIFATDILIRGLLREEIVRQHDLKRLRINYHEKDDVYKCDRYHLTLFRLKQVEESEEFKNWFAQIRHLKDPLRMCCDFLDISTRSHYDNTGFYRPLTRILLESKQ